MPLCTFSSWLLFSEWNENERIFNKMKIIISWRGSRLAGSGGWLMRNRFKSNHKLHLQKSNFTFWFPHLCIDFYTNKLSDSNKRKCLDFIQDVRCCTCEQVLNIKNVFSYIFRSFESCYIFQCSARCMQLKAKKISNQTFSTATVDMKICIFSAYMLLTFQSFVNPSDVVAMPLRYSE